MEEFDSVENGVESSGKDLRRWMIGMIINIQLSIAN